LNYIKRGQEYFNFRRKTYLASWLSFGRNKNPVAISLSGTMLAEILTFTTAQTFLKNFCLEMTLTNRGRKSFPSFQLWKIKVEDKAKKIVVRLLRLAFK